MLEKIRKRYKRQQRVRSKIIWTSLKPRLSVYRSNSNIYAQIIDDTTWKTLCSSNDLKIEEKLTKIKKAEKVWEDIAKKASLLKIDSIVFDRAWFLYHWRVKALAESARNSGLKF